MTTSTIIQTIFLVIVIVLAAVTFYTDMELSVQYFKAMSKSGKVVFKEIINYTRELGEYNKSEFEVEKG